MDTETRARAILALLLDDVNIHDDDIVAVAAELEKQEKCYAELYSVAKPIADEFQRSIPREMLSNDARALIDVCAGNHPATPAAVWKDTGSFVEDFGDCWGLEEDTRRDLLIRLALFNRQPAPTLA